LIFSWSSDAKALWSPLDMVSNIRSSRVLVCPPRLWNSRRVSSMSPGSVSRESAGPPPLSLTEEVSCVVFGWVMGVCSNCNANTGLFSGYPQCGEYELTLLPSPISFKKRLEGRTADTKASSNHHITFGLFYHHLLRILTENASVGRS
jgi:hypothetical protein